MIHFFPALRYIVFEGLFVSQFDGDQTQIEASPGSPFYVFLGCSDATKKCMGPASDCKFSYVDRSNQYKRSSILIVFHPFFWQGFNQASQIFPRTTLNGASYI